MMIKIIMTKKKKRRKNFLKNNEIFKKVIKFNYLNNINNILRNNFNKH